MTDTRRVTEAGGGTLRICKGDMESEGARAQVQAEEATTSVMSALIGEITGSWINSILLVLIVVLMYKIVRRKNQVPETAPSEPPLPKMRADLTPLELRKYDGNQPDGRVLVAVDGTVFDVTKNKKFYGPGGPYAAFGGRDASRGLATFSVTASDGDYDDLSDLSPMEMDSVKEWAGQFREKYDVVGRLLRPGEEPTNYSDEETERDARSTAESDKTE